MRSCNCKPSAFVNKICSIQDKKMEDPLTQFMRAQGYADYVIERGIIGFLLPAWEETVRRIENGYTEELEEYSDEVDGRHIIDACEPYWRVDERSEIERRLALVDRRFIGATVPIEDPIWKINGLDRSHHFWYFRAPESCLDEYRLTKQINK